MIHNATQRWGWALLAAAAVALCPAAPDGAGDPATARAAETKRGSAPAPAMKKYVSKDASFVLYIPAGWTVDEGTQGSFRTLAMRDPSAMYEAALWHGRSPAGDDVRAVVRTLLRSMATQLPKLDVRNAMISRDGKRIVLDGGYSHRRHGAREFRCWTSVRGGEFSSSRIEGPAGRLGEMRQSLLTVLSNVRVTKGAFAEAAAAPPRLVRRRLPDGSATVEVPETWAVKGLGAGTFVAHDPGETSTFIVANVDVVTPQLGVSAPGVPVARYMEPHRALELLATQQGLATNLRFTEVTPRPDTARHIGQVYTQGPITVEEFGYAFDDAKRRPAKGFTVGISFGSQLGLTWRFWHMSVTAPAGAFDGLAPTFAAMMQSYRIDDAFAARYVAEGTRRLRQLQRQTAQLAARNAEEIRRTMQAAYDERQRSQDYIDYQRTNYIRGEQDWISTMEGGTVYHTDSWGTKNTDTGEYWEGKAYDYVHFEGENPRGPEHLYREQMTPVDSRELWERHVR